MPDSQVEHQLLLLLIYKLPMDNFIGFSNFWTRTNLQLSLKILEFVRSCYGKIFRSEQDIHLSYIARQYSIFFTYIIVSQPMGDLKSLQRSSKLETARCILVAKKAGRFWFYSTTVDIL